MEIIRMKNLLRKMYHILVKRDMVGPFGLRKFGKVGKGSEIYKCSFTDRNKKHIFIGENTTVLNGGRMQVYRGEEGKLANIRIGNDCYIGYNNSFLAGGNIEIEDNVLMASNILISSENHSADPESEFCYMDQPLICKDVVIGEGSWIGEKVCILPGVAIGRKCIIGAASVVTKSVPDYCMAAGSPAKVIKRYDFDSHRWLKVENDMR